MGQAQAALLGALIGAIAALIGSTITNIITLRIERIRQQENNRIEDRRRDAERRKADIQELRTRTAQAFKHLFILQHSMEWITWHAGNIPEAVTSQWITRYDDEIYAAYSEFLGAMAATASLDETIYRELEPCLSQVYAVEAEIGSALRGARGPHAKIEEALPRVARYYPTAAGLRSYLMIQLPALMTRAGATYDRPTQSTDDSSPDTEEVRSGDGPAVYDARAGSRGHGAHAVKGSSDEGRGAPTT